LDFFAIFIQNQPISLNELKFMLKFKFSIAHY